MLKRMNPGTSEGLELHGYVGCPFAWRVRLVAAAKGVRADWIACDVDDPDPRALEHNPDEHSPLLWHDGFELVESEIIGQYINDAFEGPALEPRDPRQRAELRLLATRLRGLDAHTEPSKPEARRRTDPSLRLLEAALRGGEAPFLHGESPGLTDLNAWPFLANLAVRGFVDEKRTPAVKSYVERMAERPALRATPPPWAAALIGPAG